MLPLREKLVGYAFHLLGSREEAEDVVQELYLKLWRMRDNLDCYHSVEALAMHITKNLSLTRLKQQQSREEVALDEEYDTHCSAPPAGEGASEMEYMMQLMHSLPPIQQHVLMMRHVDGLEVKEIAGITGATPENIRVNLSRARKKMRELLLNKKRV